MCSTVLNVRFTRSLRAAPIAAAKLSVTASKQLVLSIAAQIVPGKLESATCGIVRLKQRNQNRSTAAAGTFVLARNTYESEEGPPISSQTEPSETLASLT